MLQTTPRETHEPTVIDPTVSDAHAPASGVNPKTLRTLKMSPWLIRGSIGLLSVGGLVYFTLLHPASHGPSGSTPSAAAPKSQTVNNGTDVLVRAYRISDPTDAAASTYTLSGTLQPRYSSQLGFRIAGKIIERTVEVGDRVRQGQVLYRLDPEDSQLQLQVAESDLAAAQSQLQLVVAEEKRLAELKRTNSASQSDYDIALSARDTARARLDSAERRWQLAKNQREYCALTADQDGLVVKLYAEVGQVVAAGQGVLQWVQGDELEAVVSVPESLLSTVQNDHAQISFWSLPDQRIEGHLREISPIADPASRTYDARFQLKDRLPGLALGMTATVHLIRAQRDGMRLPMGAVANAGDRPIVWRILDEGHVQAVPVQISKYEKDSAIVTGDLHPGDLVVSAGAQRIDDRCRVRIWYEPR